MVAEFCLLIGYIPCSLMRMETAARYPSGSDKLVRSTHYRSTFCILRCSNAELAILVKMNWMKFTSLLHHTFIM